MLDEDRTRLHERGMSREEAAEVADFVEAKLSDVTWNAFTADEWVVRSREDPRVLREERIVKTLAQEGLVRNLPDGRMVDKVLCMCLPERSAEVECTLKHRFPSLSISRSSDILVEVNAAGVSKAIALRAFCDAKGIRARFTSNIVGDVQVEGLSDGMASDLRKRCLVWVGRPLDRDRIEHAVQRLTESPSIATVDYQLGRTASGDVLVRLDVRQSPELEVGVSGYTTNLHHNRWLYVKGVARGLFSDYDNLSGVLRLGE